MDLKIDNNQDCCGCKVCADICPKDAISFKNDKEGFWYPKIDMGKCVDCRKCELICPQLKNIVCRKPLEVYAARIEDKKVLRQSSSGGLFTALATEVIEKEKGHVYCVQYDQNMIARFKKVEKVIDLEAGRGSKYVQADPDGVYNEILSDLKNGIFVMFIGTPCQASAVRSITRHFKNKILIVDFICHGVPSPMLFADFIRYVEKKNKSKVIRYNNRSKVEGWKHLEEITFQNGKSDYKSSLSQAWRNIFYTHNCLRPSCYECRFNHFSNRESDITIADFWGIDNYHPDFASDDGNSVLVEYTETGKRWFDRISNDISYIQSTIENCLDRQPHFRGESAVALNREEFWKDYFNYGIAFLTRKYGKCSFKLRIKKYIKHFICKVNKRAK